MRGILRWEQNDAGELEGLVVEELPENVPQGGPVSIRDSFLGGFASSRFFAAFGVIGAFLGAAALYIYGTFVVVATFWDTVARRTIDVDGANQLQVALVQLTDVFLLGTVLTIVWFSLYQLFLDPGLPVPNWPRIDDLDQLTMKVMEVVGLLLGVTFLAFAAELRPQDDVLKYGLAIAAVIFALCALLIVSHRVRGDVESPRRAPPDATTSGPDENPPRPPPR